MSHRLSHVVAVSKSAKSAATNSLTAAHHALQRTNLLNGLSRTYQSLVEEDQVGKPSESTLVQVSADSALKSIEADLVRLFDVTATQDHGNTLARADVKVDGQTLIHGATVPFLLFLEKQLVDIGTLVKKLPTLDAGESWELDGNTGHYKTAPAQTISNKKVFRNHEKAPATEKHPAQVEVYTEDVPVGIWSTVKFSGALPATRVKELSARVAKLQDAVKIAREEANATEVPDVKVGKAVFDWLFA